MTDTEFEQATDDRCADCTIATSNSSDGGQMPCAYHKMRLMQRDYPVIEHDLYDGEWTHTWVDSDRIYAFVEGVLNDYDDSELTITEYLHKLNPKVVYMTKQEHEEIPEL